MLYDRQATCICGHTQNRHGYKLRKCFSRIFVREGNRIFEVPCSCMCFQPGIAGHDKRLENQHIAEMQLRQVQPRHTDDGTKPVRLQADGQVAKRPKRSLFDYTEVD